MIEQVDTVVPGVTVYSTEVVSGFAVGDFVRLYEEEVDRTWSHLPFFNGMVGHADYADSFWSDVGAIRNAEQGRLFEILSKYHALNHVMEQCLDDYKIFYRCVWHRDSGSQVMKVEGHKFSTDFAPPDNGWSSTAFMALTDLTVLLTKFGKEIPVRKGQIVVVPAQFPYDFQVKPSPSGLAYFLLKHLFPA